MIFRIKGISYKSRTAIELVRDLERDDKDYPSCGGALRQYLSWSLNHLSCSVPARDLDLSDRLEDETLALGYLLLLDENGVGEMVSESSGEP